MNSKRGYKIGKDRYFRLDGDNFALLRGVLKDIARNKITLKEAAEILNKKKFKYNEKNNNMGKTKLSDICADPFYCGFYLYGGKKIIELKKANPEFVPTLTYQEFLQIRHNFRSEF